MIQRGDGGAADPHHAVHLLEVSAGEAVEVACAVGVEGALVQNETRPDQRPADFAVGVGEKAERVREGNVAIVRSVDGTVARLEHWHEHATAVIQVLGPVHVYDDNALRLGRAWAG